MDADMLAFEEADRCQGFEHLLKRRSIDQALDLGL
jgi:hypothetical protein